MKGAKVILLLMLAAVGVVSALWVLGLIGDDAATDTMKRTVGAIAIFGAFLGAVVVLTKGSKEPESGSQSQKPGPKF